MTIHIFYLLSYIIIWDVVSDGPFDIIGLGFLVATSYFFSLFAQVIFSIVTCNKFFFSNNTFKSEKYKRKQHI